MDRDCLNLILHVLYFSGHFDSLQELNANDGGFNEQLRLICIIQFIRR